MMMIVNFFFRMMMMVIVYGGKRVCRSDDLLQCINNENFYKKLLNLNLL